METEFLMSQDLNIFMADEPDVGQRLDKWLASVCDLSRSRIQALINQNAVKIEGEVVTSPSRKVVADKVYSIEIPPLKDPVPKGENIPLDIYFEDEHLIVVNKPSGMTVHPAPGSASGTLVNALIHHARDSLSGIGGVLRPGIVHRIDKDTSGLLVVAKNDKTHTHLSRQFAKHSVKRVYECFVRNQPRPHEGRIESRLARSPHNRQKQAVVKGTWGDMEASEHGRHAITNYRFIKGFGLMPKAAVGTPLVSQIECRLETGRTHQIRVHMAHSGCPLLGDQTYGRQKAFQTSKNPAEIQLNEFLRGFKRQALHARSLGFIHPVTKEFMDFHSEFPADLLTLLEMLEKI